MRMRLLCGITILLSAACGTDVIVPPPPAPEIQSSAVANNPNNVLSGVVTAQVRFSDSVAVRYRAENTTLDNVTPAVVAANGSALIPLLGLHADTRYTLQVIAYGAQQTAQGTPFTFTSGTLPADLPAYVATGVDPSPGYVAFAAGQYGIVIDNTGRVVWYHRFLPNGPGLNFQAQPNGRFVAHPPPTDPSQAGHWVEVDVVGNVTRTLGCLNGLRSRLHDLLAEPNGSYWLLCDETRTMDLSVLGGATNSRVTGTVIQHVSATGGLLFQWSTFDHFDISDLTAAELTPVNINWTHGNALDIDAEGDLLVSFRNLSEVTKIDTQTGQVLWRMGGRRNQFTFESSPTPPFASQHGLRTTAPGQLVLLDNLGDPTGTKARRYTYNESTRTARLVASYGSAPQVIAFLGGTTQNLPGGHTLVAFGNGGRVEEYDATGRVVWRIEGNPGYIFRAQRIQSLYAPAVGAAR